MVDRFDLVKIPLENSIEENLKVVLGWMPFFLGENMGSKLTGQNGNLILGPGKTLNLESLFELPGKTADTKAGLEFDVNLTSTASAPAGPRDIGKISRGPVTDDPLISNLKNRLKETRYENEKLAKQNQDIAQLLRSKIEKEKQGQQQSNYQPPREPSPPVNQNISQSAFSPEFERQSIQRLDQLIASINDLKGKQEVIQNQNQQYPPASNAHLYNSSVSQKNPYTSERPYQSPIPIMPPSQGNVDYESRFRDAAARQGNQPGYQNNDISRVDRAAYLSAGIGGINNQLHTDPNLAGLNIKGELEDYRKISTVIIQVLGIKYVSPNGDPSRFNFPIPDRLFLTFDFFTFPTFRSKVLTYYGTNPDELHALPMNFKDRPLTLVNEEVLKGGSGVKEPYYMFEVNPLTEGTVSVYEDLVKYLATKELVVDIWDGESLMLFGRGRTRLHNLLRQGKDVEIFTPSIEVFDEKSNEIRAVLQLNLKNQAMPIESRMVDGSMRSGALASEQLHFYFNRTAKSSKYKVKSFKPMDIQKELASGFDASKNVTEAELMDEEHRKRLRIDRFKVLRSQMPISPQTGSIGPHNSLADVQSFNQSLKEVEAIRERKKPEVIANALARGYSEEHLISAQFGKPKYITYKFENIQPIRTDFKVVLEYGKGIIPQEFSLVRNRSEWQSACDKMKVEHPPEYGMLETTDIFTLNGGEGLVLIVKFLSFDESGIIHNKTVEKVASLNIIDMRGQVLCGLAIRFMLRAPVVDRSLHYTELESRGCTIDLPPFFPQGMVRSR